jgi:release factor glutamine methyltransferase
VNLAGAAATLAAAGVASPRFDAEELAAHVLGVPRSRLSVAESTAEQDAAFDALIRRRAAREPLQHITGEAPFRHIVLAVGPGVFIPRPETEGLVDLVLDRCGPGRVAVDLCAGSGAVAAAIAAERPGTEVHAVELSAPAMPWLTRNAGFAVVVHHEAVASFGGVVADVVVSNPPYLPDGLDLAPEVRADPAPALWGGPDGLAVIDDVIACALRLLRPGGLVAIEHDVSHQSEVLERLRHNGFCDVLGHDDLTGRPRYATGVRMSP